MSRARSCPSPATTIPRCTRVSSARRSIPSPIRSSWMRIRPTWASPRPSSSRTRPISSTPRSRKSATTTCFRENAISHDAADAARDANKQALALVELDAATVAQKAAVLKAAQINLNYTNIVSPVDGTVVSRNVTAGQTVAASFQTPTLFLIATDLTKMQVDTNVSESDIAGAVQGASASFTVDAFPNRTFQGRVAQVRQAPISVQNVITYDVVITVANPGLLLKPGMTATAKIVKAQARNVLRVPSQALRFTPAGAAKPDTAATHRAAHGLGGARRQAGRGPRHRRARRRHVRRDQIGRSEGRRSGGDVRLGGRQHGRASGGDYPFAASLAGNRHGRSRRQPRRPDPVLPARRHRGSRAAGRQPVASSAASSSPSWDRPGRASRP